ncbi:glycosyltransferase [Paenibacillus sp. EPM92]|uniref:glycosyltransferase n=1 Tax=Paenibacillus sp. EPM92 TaxID=1561195 RepID=UPI001916437E|nr:glycosyltransferase [Paenibacillus sp. EPM92]
MDYNTDFKIRINPKNLGVTKNFETTIKACNGDIVFICDQDDIWLENKVERIIKIFENNKEVDVIFTNAYLVNNQLTKFKDTLWDTIKFNPERSKKNGEDLFSIFLNRNIATGATMAFRKSFVEKILPMPEEWIHDGWIAITALLEKKLYAYPEKLILYRQHLHNVIGAKNEGILTKVRKYLGQPDKITHDNYNKFKRYESVIEYISNNSIDVTTTEINNIKQCVKFWEDKCGIVTRSKLKSIINIMGHVKKGHYNQFATGYRAVIKDVFNLLKV